MAGKNPLGHVGKVYDLLARQIAQALCASLTERKFACSAPSAPPLDVVEVAPHGTLTSALRRQVADLAAAQIADVGALTNRLLRGELAVFGGRSA